MTQVNICIGEYLHFEMDKYHWYWYLHLEMDKYHPQGDKRCAGFDQEAERISVLNIFLESYSTKNNYSGKHAGFDKWQMITQ